MKARVRAVALAHAAALLVAAPLLAEGVRPDTVFFEDLTFDEIRDAIREGATSVIIAAGGLEDGDGAAVSARPTDLVTYTVDRIARELGGTLVAPVLSYSAGGLVPLAESTYDRLLEAAATSARGSGFKTIFLLAESAASQPVLERVAGRLDAAWTGAGVRVLHVSDFYTKARAAQEQYASERRGEKPGSRVAHAHAVAQSELIAINARRVHVDQLTDRALATPPHGLALLQIRIDSAVAQMRPYLSRPVTSAAASFSDRPRVLPTPDPRAAATGGVFLEDLTAQEIRDAVADGRTVAIVPTGGTEKNGFHMAVGKHNFHARAGADLMAKTLGNALVAPVLQYVPEGQATEANPGTLSCARECFEPVVEDVVRGLRRLGFTEVLLIGDNGGNQGPLAAVADRLTAEWGQAGTRVHALTDFYDKGHEYQDVWFLSQFGWDESVVGSHAGIKDTSQMLYVKPQDVRTNRIADSVANRQESSISGDPTRATAEFGRLAIAFKANGAIAQYRALTPQTPGGRRGRSPSSRRNDSAR